MKKSTKNIIIALAVLLVLGGAAAALILLNPAQTEPETSSSSTSSEALDKLIDKAITDVKNITLTNSETGETYTVVPAKKSADSTENDTFTVEGWENEAVLTDDILSLAQKFYSVSPSKEIGAVENLSEYGLSGAGVVKAVTTYTDGTTDTMLIGSEAGETYGRYVLYNDKVYIVTQATSLMNSKFSFIDTAVIAIPNPTVTDAEGNESEGTATLTSLHLSGTNFPEEIRMSYSETDEILVYTITEPLFSGAGSTKTDNILKQLQTITASGVAAVQATDAELESFGLKTPTAVAEFEISGEKHTLTLGAKKDGVYYMTVDGGKTVYTIAADSVSEWAETDLFSLRDGYVRLPNIKSVQRLTVTAADGTEVYDVERIQNEEKSTESAPFYDLTVTKDGAEINYDYYQPFYKMILSVSILNEEIREPQGEPTLTYRYEYFDGKVDEISYYADSSAERRYIVTLNGVPSGIVRSTVIDEILAAKPLLAQNLPVDGSDPVSSDSAE